MSKIHLLNKDIIPKIAAGEVIQRPVSVVKELLENALDAGAKNIVVEIENAGLAKIKVIDDGYGMSKEDLLNSFLSHTTSKIHSIEDLALIRTYGFRGEALYSICTMADVVIRSTQNGAGVGNLVSLVGSKLENTEKASLAKGTIVEVYNLFSRFPARKKFLKSNGHENHLIQNLLSAYAFAHDAIGFEFYLDGKLVFRLTSRDNLLARIRKLLGPDVATQMLRVDYSNSNLSVEGYIAKPQLNASTRADQFLFVNNRYVDDLGVSKAVKSAYKNLLDARSYPVFILNIKLDFGLVDVNVHPQKENVRFWNERVVHSSIFDAVHNVLTSNDLTFTAYSNYPDTKAVKHLYSTLKDSNPTWDLSQDASESFDHAFQIGRTYIAYPGKDCLHLIDQHAAHESILFEQFLKDFSKKVNSGALYTFDTPIIFNIPIKLQNVFNTNRATLSELGFKFDDFGVNTIKITQVPYILKDHDPVYLIDHILADLNTNESFSTNSFTAGNYVLDNKTLKTLAYLSCRSAVKAGDKLEQYEIKNLLIKLSESKEIYTCPHGRPVKTKMPLRELAKIFKRIR